MKSTFCLVMVLLVNAPIFSQVQSLNREKQQFATWDLTRQIKPTEKGINGSPYIQEYFVDAQVDLSGNASIVPVRYNAALDEMEFKKEDKIYALVPADSTTVRMLLLDNLYTYQNYTLDNEVIKGYLLKKTRNSTVNLYVKESVAYIPLREAVSAYESARPARYEKKSDTYLIGIQNSIQKIFSNKKELFKLFPENEEKISQFIKTNKTSFKQEADLITLVNFLNTL